MRRGGRVGEKEKGADDRPLYEKVVWIGSCGSGRD